MPKPPFELRFDPQTINHLGLRMYSTLPPALAELVSNSYDADSSNVTITLKEEKRVPKEIIVEDNGMGMSYDEISAKFLMIGRNRRADEGDTPSKKFNRLPTGKKGLGKLALFGLANTIIVTTRQHGFLNEFMMNWDDLMNSAGSPYRPSATRIEEKTKLADGTTIQLLGLKRKTSFDSKGLADSLSGIFIFEDNFNVTIVPTRGDNIVLDNKRKYAALSTEFTWDLRSPNLVPPGSPFDGKLMGQIMTAEKPISPGTGLRGITLYSRGKLVNAPEYFSDSASSYFYQYLTGWITVDFIDLLSEDVISTDRKSLNWEHEKMAELREFLATVVAIVNKEWRDKRKSKKEKSLEEESGIDTKAWFETMPDDVEKQARLIVKILEGDDAAENFRPAVQALHELVPEYPLLHWRRLHEQVKSQSKEYYEKQDYYHAFFESMKKYSSAVKQKSGLGGMQDKDLMGKAFHLQGILDPMGAYCKKDGTEFDPFTQTNIREGQLNLSIGIVGAARNPLAHEEVEELRSSDLFSEHDCLDMLSLLSHLFKRLDNSKKKP